MEITFLNGVIEASEATYPNKLHQFGTWQPKCLDTFCTLNFSGYVASNEAIIVLAFRGTHNDWNTLDSFVDSLGQWLTNVNYNQVVINDSYRVHKGFHEELNFAIERIVQLLNAHGIGNKPLVITGHSAGGALATLAGRRLFELGIKNCQVYSFSAPKVGDSNFVNTYPIPLVRVEAKNDLIPFFPLHPMLSDFVGELAIYSVVEFTNNLFPKLNFQNLKNVEYYHAGQLLYITNDDLLIHKSSINFWDILSNEVEDLFKSIFDDDYGKKEIYDGKIIPMPNEFVDFIRIVAIFEAIDEAIKSKKVDFFKDHGISLISTFFKTLKH